MKSFHRVAAENFIASLSLDADYLVKYTDSGNDGVKIEATYEINQYRNGDPIIYRVRHGVIYTQKIKGFATKKGKELATYELDGSITKF